jgi:hypothetical protein
MIIPSNVLDAAVLQSRPSSIPILPVEKGLTIEKQLHNIFNIELLI